MEQERRPGGRTLTAVPTAAPNSGTVGSRTLTSGLTPTAANPEITPVETPRAPVTGKPLVQLSEKARDEIINLTRLRVTAALPKFLTAAELERGSLKAMVKAERQLLLTLVDLVVGKLVPVVGAVVGEILNDLPPSISTEATALVLALQHETSEKVLHAGVDKAAEHAKEAIAAGDATELDAFIDFLEHQFDRAGDNIRIALPQHSDMTILATYAKFDPDESQIPAYRALIHGLIRDYRQDVEPIGKVEDQRKGKQGGEWMYEWTERTTVVKVQAGGGTVEGLALVRNVSGNAPQGEGYQFVRWLPRSMYEIADAKVRATSGAPMLTIAPSEMHS